MFYFDAFIINLNVNPISRWNEKNWDYFFKSQNAALSREGRSLFIWNAWFFLFLKFLFEVTCFTSKSIWPVSLNAQFFCRTCSNCSHIQRVLKVVINFHFMMWILMKEPLSSLFYYLFYKTFAFNISHFPYKIWIFHLGLLMWFTMQLLFKWTKFMFAIECTPNTISHNAVIFYWYFSVGGSNKNSLLVLKKQQDDRIIIKIAFQAFAMNAFNKSQVFG